MKTITKALWLVSLSPLLSIAQTPCSPQRPCLMVITSGSAATTLFSQLSPGTINNGSTYSFGGTSTLIYTGSGVIDANRLMHVDLSTLNGMIKMFNGVPSAGVPGVDFVGPTGTVANATAAVTATNLANAANILAGTLPAARLPAIVGDTTVAVGTNTSSTVRVNGAALPVSASYVGTNNVGQIVPATPPVGLVVPGTAGQVPTTNGAGGFGIPVTLSPSGLIDTTNAANLSSGLLPPARVPDLSGAYSTKVAGGDLSGTLPSPTVAKINGTSVPVNATVNQLLGTVAPGVGSWITAAPCLDALGQHLNFDPTTHTFLCGTSSAGGTAANPGGTVNQIQFNQLGTSFAGFTVNGDGTLNVANGALLVTKTNGAPFAPSATLDATNAANITSGTLAAARLPGSITSNTSGSASTANALTVVPTKCSAGFYPLGIDASGNALNCTSAAAAQVNADWLATTGPAFIANKPSVLGGGGSGASASITFPIGTTGAQTFTHSLNTLAHVLVCRDSFGANQLMVAPPGLNADVVTLSGPIPAAITCVASSGGQVVPGAAGTILTSAGGGAFGTPVLPASLNVGTATALQNTPNKCSAGQYPLGVDRNGNAVNCTVAGTGSGGGREIWAVSFCGSGICNNDTPLNRWPIRFGSTSTPVCVIDAAVAPSGTVTIDMRLLRKVSGAFSDVGSVLGGPLTISGQAYPYTFTAPAITMTTGTDVISFVLAGTTGQGITAACYAN